MKEARKRGRGGEESGPLSLPFLNERLFPSFPPTGVMFRWLKTMDRSLLHPTCLLAIHAICAGQEMIDPGWEDLKRPKGGFAYQERGDIQA